MATRADEVAARFEAINGELIAAVEGCSEGQWRQPCVNEERAVGVVAHHVAIVYPAFARMVGMFAAGETYTPGGGMDDIHAINAQHAQDQAGIGKAEVLDLLRANGAAIAEQLRGLGDERFDAVAGVFGGNELRVAQVVDYVVIGHTREHLGSVRATLGG